MRSSVALRDLLPAATNITAAWLPPTKAVADHVLVLASNNVRLTTPWYTPAATTMLTAANPLDMLLIAQAAASTPNAWAPRYPEVSTPPASPIWIMIGDVPFVEMPDMAIS